VASQIHPFLSGTRLVQPWNGERSTTMRGRNRSPAYFPTARVLALLGLVLTLGAFPARAQLPAGWYLAGRDGTPTSYWTTAGGVSAEYVSWTQPAGIQYSGVAIDIVAHCQGGIGAGVALLYSAPGSSATLTAAATLVATAVVSVPGNASAPTHTPLFTNLTLSAGYTPVTYYLLLVPSNPYLAWDVSNAPHPLSGYFGNGNGTVVNADQGNTTGAIAAPPSGSVWSALSPSGMLFSVVPSGSAQVSPVPALTPWALLGLAALLGVSGCWLGKQPYREPTE